MTITLNGTTGITLPNGSASAPAATGSDTDTGIVYGTNTVQVATGGTTAVTVDSSQNVGIGTSSPSSRLHVAASSSSTTVARLFDSSGYGFYFLTSAVSPYQQMIHSGGGEALAFGTNGANERMRIDSSGNLLVGNTSFGTTGKSNLYFAPASQYGMVFAVASNTFSNGYIRFQNAAGSQIGQIISNDSGSTTTYATSSDYRLKENVAPMTGALAKVSALKPVTYTWKESGINGQGFIAHELQAVVPDCVTGEKDAVDAEGNPVYQGIDTSFLVATLTAAIQEQQAIITSQTNAITALEARLTALEQA